MKPTFPIPAQREAAVSPLAEWAANGAERGSGGAAPERSAVHSGVHSRLVVPSNPVLREVAHLAVRMLPPDICTRIGVLEELWSITGDPGEIHQALIHVLLNARAAMGKGGNLDISARNVTMHEIPPSPAFDAQPGDFVEIAIKHTGLDIYQSPLGPDVGHRLACVARVLRSHGGFGQIESRAGLPATIALYFPRAGSAHIPAASATGSAPPVAGTILIVDDEEAILTLSRLILSRAGYRVLVARDGHEAMEHFWRRRSEIGLLLTDLSMPGVSGFTLLWAIRRCLPGLPVLVATGDHTEENHRALECLGVKQVLAKPFTPRHLLDAVARTLVEPVQCEPSLFLFEWDVTGDSNGNTSVDLRDGLSLKHVALPDENPGVGKAPWQQSPPGATMPP